MPHNTSHKALLFQWDFFVKSLFFLQAWISLLLFNVPPIHTSRPCKHKSGQNPMNDNNKTKAQLIAELTDMRQRVAELETQPQSANGANVKDKDVKQTDVGQPLHKKSIEFEAIFKAIPDGVVFVDLNRQIVMCNPALTTIFGYTPEEIIGKHTKVLYASPEDYEVQGKLRFNLSAEEKVKPYEVSYRRKSGETFVSETMGTAVKNSQGNTLGFLGIIRDITSRKQTQAELEQSITQLTLINDIGSKIVSVLDVNSLLNRAAYLVQEMFNYHHVALFLIEDDLLKQKAVAGAYKICFSKNHTQPLTVGLNGWVATYSKKIVANNIKHEPRYTSLISDDTVTQSELTLPINIGSQTIGVLDIQSPFLNTFSDNDIVAMETLTNQIAIAIENARLHTQTQYDLAERTRAENNLREVNRKLLTLQAAGAAIASSLDIDYVLETITREMVNLLQMDGCAIAEWDKDENTLVVMTVFGPLINWDESILSTVYPLKDYPIHTQVLEARRIQHLKSNQADLHPPVLAYMQRMGAKTVLMLPMEFQDSIVGLVEVLSVEAITNFPVEDISLAQLLANQAAGAIKNAHLYEMVQKELFERIRIEEALREGERRYKKAQEIAQFGYWERDFANNKITWSPESYRIYGIDLSNQNISYETFLSLVHPEDKKYLVDSVNTALSTKGSLDIEYRITHPDQSVHILHSVGEVRLNQAGYAVGLVGAVQDITQRKQAGNALRKSEATNRAILNAIPDLMFRTHRDGTYLEAVLGIPRKTYASLDEIIGKKAVDVLPPEAAKLRMQSIEQALQTENIQIYEFQLPIEGEGLKDFEVRTIASGPDETLSILRDITDRKQLENSWRRYEFLVNTSRDFLTLINGEHTYEAVNEAYCQAHNKTRVQIVNKSIAEVWGKERYLEYIKPWLDQSFKGEIVHYQEWFDFSKLGWRYFDVAYYPYHNHAGFVTHIVVVSRDTTDRKLAEDKLQTSEERFRQVISSISDHIYVTRIRQNESAFNLYLSPHIETLTGYPQKNFEEKWDFWSKVVIHPDDREIATTQLKLLATNQNSEMEYRIVKADGSIIWVRDSARVEIDKADQTIYGVVSDITQRKLVEKQLKQLNQDLAILNTVITTVNEAPNLADMLELALEQVTALMNMDGSDCYLVDPNGLLMLTVHCGLSSEFVTAKSSQINKEIYEYILTHGSVLSIANITTEKNFAGLDVVQKNGYKSLLIVPIFGQDTILGTFTLYSQAVLRLTVDMEKLLITIGRELGIAVERAQLYEAERSRRQEAETLRQATAALNSALGPAEVLDTALGYLKQIIPYDSACIFLRKAGKLQAIAEQGLLKPEKIIGQEFPVDNFLFQKLQQTKQALYIQDIRSDSRFENWGEAKKISSWIGVPLIVRQKIIGYLTIDNKNISAYSNAEVTVTLAFANQAAIAIENAQLFEEIQDTLVQTEILYQMTRSLISLENLTDTLQEVVDKIVKALPADRVVLITLNVEQQEITRYLSGGPGTDQAQDVSFAELWAGLTGWTLRHLEPVLSLKGDVPDPRESSVSQQHRRETGCGAIIVAPMYYKEKLLGTLTAINRLDQVDFITNDVELVVAIANQAAIAIENTWLFEQVQQELAERERIETEILNLNEGLEQRVADSTRELRALYSVSAVASMALDIETTQIQVLKQALTAIKSNTGVIHILDEDGTTLKLNIQQNLTVNLAAQIDTVSLKNSLPGWIIENAKPLLVSRVSVDPLMFQMVQDYGFQTYIGVPMRTQGQILGVLSVFGQTQDQFALEDVDLLASIGDQVGVVIENAHLRQRAEQAAIMEERARLARDLHDVVSQNLFSASVIAESLPLLWDRDPELLKQSLRDLHRLTRGASAEMRTLLLELRPAALVESKLNELLNQLTQALAGRTLLEVSLQIEGREPLPLEVKTALYRITQETLNNVAKHARATQVTVSLNNQSDQVKLTISDNGRGFNPNQVTSGHFGVDIMHERAKAVHAELQIDSQLEHGTTVNVIWIRM